MALVAITKVLVYAVLLMRHFAQSHVEISNEFEGNKQNGSCIGELIKVHCSVNGSSLRWTISRSSFQVTGIANIVLFAFVGSEGTHRVIPTTTNDLHIYQNRTIVNVIDPENSRIDSEMHIQLDNENDFVEVTCISSNTELKSTEVAVLGPPSSPKLRSVYNFTLLGRSYHHFIWTMESENDIDYYMLNCSDDYRPQNIYPHQNAFYYEKDMEHNAIVTLIAINKCGKISSKSNSLFLPVIKMDIFPMTTCGSQPASTSLPDRHEEASQSTHCSVVNFNSTGGTIFVIAVVVVLMVAVAGLAALAVAIILYVRKGEGSACKKKIAPLNRGSRDTSKSEHRKDRSNSKQGDRLKSDQEVHQPSRGAKLCLSMEDKS